MIPLYRTTKMEDAANVLVARFRHVVIQAHHELNNRIYIRFRADKIKSVPVYFDRVKSQRARWAETGGAIMTWTYTRPVGPHDAMIIVESPKWIEMFETLTRNTASVAVLYTRPNWKPFEDQIRLRTTDRPTKTARQLRRLELTKVFVENLPEFTSKALDRILPVLPELSQRSVVRGLHEASAHSPDNSY